MNEAENQAVRDDQHLRLLSIAYVAHSTIAGLVALCGLALYVWAAQLISDLPDIHTPDGTDRPPGLRLLTNLRDTLGGVLAATLGGVVFAVCAAIAVGGAFTARALKRRSSWRLCYCTAVLSLLMVPLGTILAGLTFSVLTRSTVRERFR